MKCPKGSDISTTSFEELSGGARLFEDRKLTYYNLNLGYNILPVEGFIGETRAYNTQFYLLAGLGSTEFADDDRFTVNFVSSVESDFDANTYAFSVSEDMFGDLTTLTLSYAYGEDVVGKSDDPAFRRENTRQHYGVGVTQILTRNLIATLNFETVTDEGFLNNPYRSVRYADPGSAVGFSFEPELYPETRTSNALGVRARYFLPYRAAIEGEYRFYVDTWDIESQTASLTYVHPWGPYTFEGKFRYHDQTGAAFFRDIFPRSEATNFRGRDKELSPLTSYTFRGKVSYEFIDPNKGWGIFKRGSLNFSLDHLFVEYHEFRDITSGSLGDEALYELKANVYQVFVSFWYRVSSTENSHGPVAAA